ncbi:hypothetical protein PTI98_011767 [Pleurotus ostreatus]|nr:hypothetical protein PTI98_011767 [Pleurotus ostreatus]
MISENIEADRAKLASVTTIAGAGHYVGDLISTPQNQKQRTNNDELITTMLLCSSSATAARRETQRVGQRDIRDPVHPGAGFVFVFAFPFMIMMGFLIRDRRRQI